jgi:hypothetical protein
VSEANLACESRRPSVDRSQRMYKHIELELTFERANAVGKLLDLFVEFFGGC